MKFEVVIEQPQSSYFYYDVEADTEEEAEARVVDVYTGPDGPGSWDPEGTVNLTATSGPDDNDGMHSIVETRRLP